MDLLTTYIRDINLFLQNQYWVVELFIIIFSTTSIAYFEKRLFYKHYKNSEFQSDDTYHAIFHKAMYAPLQLLIWTMGLYVSFWSIKGFATGRLLWPIMPVVRNVCFIVVFLWFSNRFIRGMQLHMSKKCESKESKLDITTVHALCQLLRITVVLTAVLSIMRIFNIDISAILTVSGIGGVGLAFAAKDLLANFFGGFMIFLDRPFAVGDWIRSPDKDIEGTVEYIGWRLTRIRTFDKRPRYVPNNVFLSIVLDNPSRMTNRRIKTQFGLRYADASKIETILSQVKDMLMEHPEIDDRQTLMVNLVHFGDSALDVLVYTFTKTVNWVKFQSVQQDVFLKIIKIVRDNGAQCAFPTRSVYLKSPEEPT